MISVWRLDQWFQYQHTAFAFSLTVSLFRCCRLGLGLWPATFFNQTQLACIVMIKVIVIAAVKLTEIFGYGITVCPVCVICCPVIRASDDPRDLLIQEF